MDVWHTDVHVLFKDDQERLLKGWLFKRQNLRLANFSAFFVHSLP